jgi:hypothetical protein
MKRTLIALVTLFICTQFLAAQEVKEGFKPAFARLNGIVFSQPNLAYDNSLALHKIWPIGRISPTIAFERPNSNQWLEVSLLAFGINSKTYRNDTVTTGLLEAPVLFGNVGTFHQKIHAAFGIGMGKFVKKKFLGCPMFVNYGITFEYSKYQFISELPNRLNYYDNNNLAGAYGSIGVRVLERGRFFLDLDTRTRTTFGITRTNYSGGGTIALDLDMNFDLPILHMGYRFRDASKNI